MMTIHAPLVNFVVAMINATIAVATAPTPLIDDIALPSRLAFLLVMSHHAGLRQA